MMEMSTDTVLCRSRKLLDKRTDSSMLSLMLVLWYSCWVHTVAGSMLS